MKFDKIVTSLFVLFTITKLYEMYIQTYNTKFKIEILRRLKAIKGDYKKNNQMFCKLFSINKLLTFTHLYIHIKYCQICIINFHS